MEECTDCYFSRNRSKPPAPKGYLAKWISILIIAALSFIPAEFILAPWVNNMEGKFGEDLAVSFSTLLLVAFVSAAGIFMIMAIGRIVVNYKSTIKGQTVNYFLDSQGTLHKHVKKPTAHEIGFDLNSVIFKIRIGGWFRKCSVIHDHWKHSTTWKIYHCWTGDDIRIVDFNGNILGKPLKLHELIAIASLYTQIEYMYHTCEHLGITVTEVIETAKQDKAGAGRSKAAMAIRRKLEGQLDFQFLAPIITDALRASWLERIPTEETEAVAA